MRVHKFSIGRKGELLNPYPVYDYRSSMIIDRVIPANNPNSGSWDSRNSDEYIDISVIGSAGDLIDVSNFKANTFEDFKCWPYNMTPIHMVVTHASPRSGVSEYQCGSITVPIVGGCFNIGYVSTDMAAKGNTKIYLTNTNVTPIYTGLCEYLGLVEPEKEDGSELVPITLRYIDRGFDQLRRMSSSPNTQGQLGFTITQVTPLSHYVGVMPNLLEVKFTAKHRKDKQSTIYIYHIPSTATGLVLDEGGNVQCVIDNVSRETCVEHGFLSKLLYSLRYMHTWANGLKKPKAEEVHEPCGGIAAYFTPEAYKDQQCLKNNCFDIIY